MKAFFLQNQQHSKKMKKIFYLLTILLLFLSQIFAPVITGKASPNVAGASSPVYTDGLDSGWQDWSYGGVTVNLASSSQVHAGSASVSVHYTGGWSGFQIGYGGNNLDVSSYDKLRFWIHGGSAGGQVIQLQIQDQNGSTKMSLRKPTPGQK